MESLVELKKVIAKKRDLLNLAIKNNETQDAIYEKSVAVDDAIAEYIKAEQYFNSERERLMNNYADILNTPFKNEVLNQIKSEVLETFSKISKKELDHFSNNVYVYAVMQAHNIEKNKIFAQLNHLNNLYFDEMQEDGNIKNSVITEKNLNYYKAINKKYLDIIKEKL